MKDDVVKQLLPWGDTTLTGAVVQNAERSCLERIVVVVGDHADEVRAALPPGQRTVVVNPDFRDGNLSSFRVGVAAAGAPAAVVVLLGDVPTVGPEIIDRFVDVWEAGQPWAAIGQYRYSLGHPLLLSAEAIAEIGPSAGSKTLWKLVREAPPGAVGRVQFACSRPWDINTMADYRASLCLLRRQSGDSAT